MRDKVVSIIRILIGLLIILLLSLLMVGKLTNQSVFAAKTGSINEWIKVEDPSAIKDWLEKKEKEGLEYLRHPDPGPSIAELVHVADDGKYYISYEDLLSKPSLFCSAKGVPLPGMGSTSVTSGGHTTSVTDQGNETAYLTPEQLKTDSVFGNIAEWSEWTTEGPRKDVYPDTTSKTIGKFASSTRICTPAEAWVLAEYDRNRASEVTGSINASDEEIILDFDESRLRRVEGYTDVYIKDELSDNAVGDEQYLVKKDGKYYKAIFENSGLQYAPYSYVQHAWWKVKTVGENITPGAIKDTDLETEAKAFEKYVLEVNGKTKVSELELNEDLTYKIDYKVSMEPTDSKNVKVQFNNQTNKYVVGPFKVDYYRAAIKTPSRDKVSFSGISDAVLVGVNSEGKELVDENGNNRLKLGENYRFVYDNEEQHIHNRNEFDTEENYPYPASNEEFYIEIDYIEDMIGIKNFKLDFQYLTSGGQFEYLTGDFMIINWKQALKDVEEEIRFETSGSGLVENDTTVALSSRADPSTQVGGVSTTMTYTNEGTQQYIYPYEGDGFGGSYWTDVVYDSTTVEGDYIIVNGHVKLTSGGWLALAHDDGKGIGISVNSVTADGAVETSKSGASFSVKYKRDYTKGAVTSSNKIVVRAHGDSDDGRHDFTDDVTVYADLYYENDLLKDDDKVSVSATSNIEFDGQKVFVNGFIGQNFENILDFDANFIHSETPQSAIMNWWVEPQYGDACVQVEDETKGTFRIIDSGKSTIGFCIIGLDGYTSIDAGRIEIEVPEFCLDKNGAKEKNVSLGDAQNQRITVEFYNAVVDGASISAPTKDPASIDGKTPVWVGHTGSNSLVAKYNGSSENRRIKESNYSTITAKYVDDNGAEVILRVNWKIVKSGPQSNDEPVTPSPSVTPSTSPSPSTTPTPNPDDDDSTEDEEFEVDDGGTVAGVSYDYWYRYQYYMVARSFSWVGAQAQANAVGSHDIINIDSSEGLAHTRDGEPVELEFLSETIDLRTSISGKVWIETEEQKEHAENTATLGVYNEGIDKLADKNSVEIVVYKVKYERNGDSLVEHSRETAIAWDEEGKEIDFEKNRIFVNENGEYTIPQIQIPAEEGLDTNKYLISYDVEFIYDGQTYESTEYLKSTGKDDVKSKLEVFEATLEKIPLGYDRNIDSLDNRNVSGLEENYKDYRNDSYIVENAEERKLFDSTFSQVYGGNPIEDNKTTEGYSSNNEGNLKKTLNYEENTRERTSNDTQQLESKLVTKNEEGYVLDEYRFAARTSEGGLLLPFENTYNVEPNYYGYLPFQEKKYTPVDEYMGQINLGLIERYKTDLRVQKDLYSAKIVVNNQEQDYRYGSLNALTEEDLQKLVETGYRNQTYKIDLYNSDYYYRSSVYNTASVELTRRVLTALKEGTELRVFVTYQVQIQNRSINTDAFVNQFKDYYDNTFTLVTEDITEEIRNNNDELENKVIAYKPYYRKLSAEKNSDGKYNYNRAEDLMAQQIDKGANGENVTGDLVFDVNEQNSNNDKFKYSESTTLSALNEDGSVNYDMVLEPNEIFEVFVTYEVDRAGYLNAGAEEYDEDNERLSLLDSKNNIAEVANYSTLYREKRHVTSSYDAEQISGRIDGNSAPDNININRVDTLEYIENDTSSAPTLKIELRGENPRRIEGTVWEDKDIEDQTIPNGIMEDDEERIKNLDVTLVEKIRLNGDVYDGKPIKYTDENGQEFDLSLYDYEFEFVWPENSYGENDCKLKSRTTTDESGNYYFENFVSGIYVVRFEYGNKEDTLKYNGQDYKNTTYQVGMKNVNQEASENGDVVLGTTDKPGISTLNNEWQDLSRNDAARQLEETRVSDARDYEPRRLKVMAYSRTITNENGEVLASYVDENDTNLTGEYAEILKEKQNDLIENTAMVANTAKLNVEIENPNQITYRQIDDGNIVENVPGTEDKEYVIRNIDFGLVQRPQTIINTKKEISKIELLKDDGATTVLSVECDNYGNIKRDNADASNINKITEISKDQLALGSQGFKYIAVEASYLKGLEVRLTYNITVTNNSEYDYVSSEIANIKRVEDLYNKAIKFETQEISDIENENYGLVPFNIGKNIVYGKYVGLYYYTNNTDAVGDSGIDLEATYGYKNYKDAFVTTTVDQVVDYIDNDLSIHKDSSGAGNYENNAWVESTSDDRQYKLSQMAYEKDGDVYNKADDKLVDNKGRSYIQGDDSAYSKNNIALSKNELLVKEDVVYNSIILVNSKENDLTIGKIETVDSEGEITAIQNIKPKLEQKTRENVYQSIKEISTSIPSIYNIDLTSEMEPGDSKTIKITTSAQANEEAMKNMNYDNLMEIVVYSNTVGRRDMEAIPGNANQIAKEVVAYKAGYQYDYQNTGYSQQTVEVKDTKSDTTKKEITTERDAYAARDTITFSEPTGLSLDRQKINTTVRIILVLLIVAAVSVIGITVVMVIKKTKYDDNHLIKN